VDPAPAIEAVSTQRPLGLTAAAGFDAIVEGMPDTNGSDIH